MHADPAERTLLEDWQAHRQWLADGPAPLGQLGQLQAQILDHLIDRYRDSPEAARPARFSPKTPLQVNERAIVVHHHVWQGKVGGVKSRQEAEARVSGILRRMTTGSVNRTTAPPETEISTDWLAAHEETFDPLVWHPALAVVRTPSHRYGLRAVEKALRKNPLAPSGVAKWLHDQIVAGGKNHLRAAALLVRCEGRFAVNYALFAWRESLQTGSSDEALALLRGFLCRADVSERAAEGIRTELANDHLRIRLGAMDLLAEIGTLDDIGLLSDLLSLPPQEDEDPQERPMLARAMEKISKRQ